MKADISIKGRPKKNDHRDLRNYVDKLHIDVTVEGDQFILAAISRALFGNGSGAVELREAIVVEAQRCADDHDRLVEARKGTS